MDLATSRADDSDLRAEPRVPALRVDPQRTSSVPDRRTTPRAFDSKAPASLCAVTARRSRVARRRSLRRTVPRSSNPRPPLASSAAATATTPFFLPSSVGGALPSIGEGFGSAYAPSAAPANQDNTGSVIAISLANVTNGATTGTISLNSTSCSALTDTAGVAAADCVTDKIFNASRSDGLGIGFMFLFNQTTNFAIVHGADAQADAPIALDFFSFGITNEGVTAGERINNNIIRIEVEESGDNTGTFGGTLEYIMLTQANILNPATYAVLPGATIDDDPVFIVHEDLTDEDAPRVNYNDLGADGVVTQVADQEETPSHSGVVSFDSNTYKIADTVVITLEDQDLNSDSEVIDIYTVVPRGLLGTGNLQTDGTLLGTVNGGLVTIVDDAAVDEIGVTGFGVTSDPTVPFGRILFVTFDDEKWFSTANFNLLGVGAPAGSVSTGSVCGLAGLTPSDAANDGLDSTGFTLVETGIETGIFLGDFQIPTDYCQAATATLVSTTGTDLEVNYQDFRDASGEFIEVGDGAGIRANTGTVSLDRTVYPVPWGALADFPAVAASATPTSAGALRSLFPVHGTGVALGATTSIDAPEELGVGDVQVHIRINDPDFDTSATGEDAIGALFGNQTGNVGVNAFVNSDGPVKIVVTRGANTLVLATAGASGATTGVITTGINPTAQTRELGQIVEIAPDAGIFELDFSLRYTDGPADTRCPATPEGGYDAINGTSGKGGSFTRFSIGDDDVRAVSVPGGVLGVAVGFPQLTAAQGDYCILQGDIITVEYRDPTDASGEPNTVTDSATFDLRNGVLQSDKSVYIIGGDLILTVIEPDWDLDNDAAETYDLDLIEWDSDAATVVMGDLGPGVFDPEPSALRETGDSTGIFQIVIEIPNIILGDNLERGEEIVLEYTDWGPSGSDFVGQEDEDINLTIFTSNFGATVELDQKVYTWTDKIYITIVAPDHNFDSNLIDEIGETALDPIKVSTRGFSLNQYKLVETGTDTGIFTGEVILTGFNHDADGDALTGAVVTGFDTNPTTGNRAGGAASGPTDGFIQTDDDDGLTVSFEFSEDETVVGSALIRWNIGELSWLEASYPASGTGVVRIVDPDLNLDPESVDNFDVDVWSDSDAGGIDLTVTETNEATGIFEGTVFFTTTDESSGHRLRVSEGDTVTAEYEDNTLPDPYTTADELDITATTIIGTIVPPLERAPAANARVVDAFGNALAEVSVDQQVQITADLANGQDREQSFAYLVQVQDGNGVTVSLAWITGSLAAGQSFSPALSWIPDSAGTYTATVFVWESVDNPTALSPPVSETINVV